MKTKVNLECLFPIIFFSPYFLQLQPSSRESTLGVIPGIFALIVEERGEGEMR